jgi:hypothetical protein
VAVTVSADRLERALAERAADLAERLGANFVDEARRRVHRRTGETWAQIQAHPPVIAPGKVTVTVESAAESSRYQDEGTGIYGPEGRRITALRPGGVLRFDWPAAGGIVFARSVAGSPGSHFWTEALRAWPQIVRQSTGR